MFLRIAYTAFIGILLATFVGVGIAAFYPGPKQPTTQSYATPVKLDSEMTQVERQQQRDQDIKNQKAWEDYQNLNKDYNRNVSSISLVSAVIILSLGLTLVRKIFMISDGLVLGGVLTLVYSIIRSFESQNNQFQFVVVSVGLIVALYLGYIKFVKTHASNLSKK